MPSFRASALRTIALTHRELTSTINHAKAIAPHGGRSSAIAAVVVFARMSAARRRDPGVKELVFERGF